MPKEFLRTKPGRFAVTANVLCGCLLLCCCFLTTRRLYRTPEGSLKDNCVIWNDGTFHLFAMYRQEVRPEKGPVVQCGRLLHGRVHWKDSDRLSRMPFGIYAMRVERGGPLPDGPRQFYRGKAGCPAPVAVRRPAPLEYLGRNTTCQA